jgi:hypothetical protein
LKICIFNIYYYKRAARDKFFFWLHVEIDCWGPTYPMGTEDSFSRGCKWVECRDRHALLLGAYVRGLLSYASTKHVHGTMLRPKNNFT